MKVNKQIDCLTKRYYTFAFNHYFNLIADENPFCRGHMF